MADCRFEKKFRLLSASDFENLKVGSLSYKKPSLVVYYKKNLHNESRIGLSIPKKIGKAHDRNRLKRLIREFFRQSTYKFLSFDILLVVSWTRNLAPLPEIEKEAFLLKNLSDFFSFLEDQSAREKE